jgi:hypothetical protein
MDDYGSIKVSPSEATSINTVSLGIVESSPKYNKIMYAIQLLSKNLLTIRGSNIFNPDEGCDLLSILGQAINSQILKSSMAETTTMVDKVFSLVDEYQNKYSILEEERVTGMTLYRFYYDPETFILYITILISTPQSSYPISIEIGT